MVLMTQYRLLTQHRKGKWYNCLADAQSTATRIGAGFVDAKGEFVAYRGTIIEMRHKPEA